ncbi:hypothetical protein GCM10010468_80250 [Actinocorallia longicatena]|uniref:Uncharacterized protein n=1 Tax=Actinocorallia longicatena TaxID=111803 RepID=A0ABP6QPR0_9ACTN
MEQAHPLAQRFFGRTPGQQDGRGVAQPGQLVAVGGLDQGLPGGEVPVEGADADARLLGDRVQGGVAVAGEGLDGRLQQPVAVALCVGAQGARRHDVPLISLVRLQNGASSA